MDKSTTMDSATNESIGLLFDVENIVKNPLLSTWGYPLLGVLFQGFIVNLLAAKYHKILFYNEYNSYNTSIWWTLYKDLKNVIFPVRVLAFGLVWYCFWLLIIGLIKWHDFILEPVQWSSLTSSAFIVGCAMLLPTFVIGEYVLYRVKEDLSKKDVSVNIEEKLKDISKFEGLKNQQ